MRQNVRKENRAVAVLVCIKQRKIMGQDFRVLLFFGSCDSIKTRIEQMFEEETQKRGDRIWRKG